MHMRGFCWYLRDDNSSRPLKCSPAPSDDIFRFQTYYSSLVLLWTLYVRCHPNLFQHYYCQYDEAAAVYTVHDVSFPVRVKLGPFTMRRVGFRNV